MLDNQEKVYYVIDKASDKRVSKFYSRLGLAKNFMKRLPEGYEAVSMYCVDYEDNLWVRIGKGFGGLLPVESSTYLNEPGSYNCNLTLQDPKNFNRIYLETSVLELRNYENQNHQTK